MSETFYTTGKKGALVEVEHYTTARGTAVVSALCERLTRHMFEDMLKRKFPGSEFMITLTTGVWVASEITRGPVPSTGESTTLKAMKARKPEVVEITWQDKFTWRNGDVEVTKWQAFS